MLSCVKRPGSEQRRAVAETCASIGAAMGEEMRGRADDVNREKLRGAQGGERRLPRGGVPARVRRGVQARRRDGLGGADANRDGGGERDGSRRDRPSRRVDARRRRRRVFFGKQPGPALGRPNVLVAGVSKRRPHARRGPKPTRPIGSSVDRSVPRGGRRRAHVPGAGLQRRGLQRCDRVARAGARSMAPAAGSPGRTLRGRARAATRCPSSRPHSRTRSGRSREAERTRGGGWARYRARSRRSRSGTHAVDR